MDPTMSEREIFLAAIEITDLQHRADYVDKACGADADLRIQVEELLKTHEQTSQFLEKPAAGPAHEQTVLTDSSDADDTPHRADSSGETEFRSYLEPATRSGWLGRLSHYEIEEILGRGAFGIVAKAFDEKLHRVVAIKLLNPELASTSPPRKRFLREARTAAAVTHENIVAIYAVEEEPIPYLVMEYIPGQTLQQWMDEHGPLDVPDVLRIGQQVAVGLGAAHAVNLIHRDIKPSNILLSNGPNERAKISDFGLARAVDDATLTSSGLIAGTPMYMAPEQARGEVLDHRADLFSLGSVLYQMASGRPPFRAANTVAVLKRVCEDTPRPLNDVIPGIPGWLETIIFRLLEKERGDRYETAQEVANLLARCESELQHDGKVTCIEGRYGNDETQVFNASKSQDAKPRKTPIGWLAVGLLGAVALVAAFVMNNSELVRDRDATTVPADGTANSTTQALAMSNATASWHGWPADAPAPAIAPFDAAQALAHQEAWAKYLGVPVEFTNSIGVTFRLIPPGEFLMGTPAEEAEQIIERHGIQLNSAEEIVRSVRSESPPHRVTLTQPFYFSTSEITIGQFQSLSPDDLTVHPAAAGSVDLSLPVSTNWNAAARFGNQLGDKAGLDKLYDDRVDVVSPVAGDFGYRLPTEAEWEFACRAGTTTRYWTGDDTGDMVKVEWRGHNSDGKRHPVGQRLANPFGLHDMHGNLMEWCHDAYADDTYSRRQGAPVVDPVSPFATFTTPAVLRGGDFGGNNDWDARAAKRRPLTRAPGKSPLDGVGIRLRLSVDAVRHLQPRTVVQAALDMNGYVEGTLSGHPLHVDREDVDKLRQRGELKVLTITLRGGPSVTDEGLTQIANLPDLGHLSIVGFGLNDRGLENLGTLPQLKSLYLEGGRQTIKALETIGHWTQIEHLTVHGLQFTDEHLEGLEQLQQLQTIRAGNLVMTEAQTQAFSKLPNLRFMWLMGEHLTDDTLRNVSRLPALTAFTVTAAEQSRITNEGARALAANERIVSVNLGGTKIDDQGLASLAERKNWEEFLLDGTRITDDGLNVLRDMPQLRSLWLSNTKVGDSGLATIATLPALEVLHLNQTHVTDSGLTHLEGLQHLKDLRLDGTRVTPQRVDQLRKKLPNCRISAEQTPSTESK
jgi:eukaryotic-like serine/threonine-protein kinase